jgi:hypothetical protein
MLKVFFILGQRLKLISKRANYQHFLVANLISYLLEKIKIFGVPFIFFYFMRGFSKYTVLLKTKFHLIFFRKVLQPPPKDGRRLKRFNF